jgi:hypothetical protein
MLDLKDSGAAEFLSYRGKRFAVAGEEGGKPLLELVLQQVDMLGDRPNIAGRIPFALLFEGPLDTRLEQSLYWLRPEGEDEILIFLVPVGRTDSAYQYEAVFN